MENISYEEALSKAMFICSKAEKCISEIRQKLSDWGIEDKDSVQIINYLVEEKFIDEERYAHFFVRDKFKFNKWGKNKIVFMMKSKKLDDSLIKEAISEISDSDYMNTIIDLISNKSKKTKSINEYEKKGKLIRFAQGRGFDYESIIKAMEQIDLQE